jgi:hypothetical protein
METTRLSSAKISCLMLFRELGLMDIYSGNHTKPSTSCVKNAVIECQSCWNVSNRCDLKG